MVTFLLARPYLHYVSGVADRVRALGIACEYVYAGGVSRDKDEVLSRSDLIVTVHSLREDVADALARFPHIPSLTLQDGVIDHRHCFERGARPLQRYWPVLTTTIAAFGQASRRLLLAWGNADQCIALTGCPRFDQYFSLDDYGSTGRHVLLTSANTPFSGPHEIDRFTAAFLGVVRCCVRAGVDVRVRLNATVVNDMRAASHRNGTSEWFDRMMSNLGDRERPLMEELRACQAVVTTPSTVVLEAMAMRRPTCLLHYDAATTYLHAAWNIRTEEDAGYVIRDMLDPPRTKLIYQESILADNVVADGFATLRVAQLIEQLVSSRR